MGALQTLFIVLATFALVYQYNLPKCGTASRCGAPIHDILHILER